MGRHDDRAGYQTARPRSATRALGLEVAEIEALCADLIAAGRDDRANSSAMSANQTAIRGAAFDAFPSLPSQAVRAGRPRSYGAGQEQAEREGDTCPDAHEGGPLSRPPIDDRAGALDPDKRRDEAGDEDDDAENADGSWEHARWAQPRRAPSR